ncbi:hypothetical protein [Alteromonas gilva]|uniref:Uncharacterized protein n=1 Tax=Alteromonas gilva TaxID=2987522 RepID=A0ABT5L2R1_9ALTE|nr:hypothetical protein [Alteromonas gilva]MDC8831329.1 hypothetical protein [Alteromonas gilva]
MQSLIKKLTIIAMATTLMGGGISSVAIAADNHKDANNSPPFHRNMPMPPAMAKAMQNLSLTDEQKAQLKAIKAKRKSLQDEFWAVFSDDQKTTMLKNMTRHQRPRHGKGSWDKSHHQGNRDTNKRWQEQDADKSQ